MNEINNGWIYLCGVCCVWPLIVHAGILYLTKRVNLTNLHFRWPWRKE